MSDQNGKNLNPSGEVDTLSELPENPAEAEPVSVEEQEDEAAETMTEESAATEISEDSKEYNEYEVYGVCEEEDDNLAAVAERITGARHTIAATAAPIRIRDTTGRVPNVPKPTAGIPVREKTEGIPRPLLTAEPDPEKKTKHTRSFWTIVSSAVALVAILTVVIVVVNLNTAENRPADFTIGENVSEPEFVSPVEKDTGKIDTEETHPADESDESVHVEPDEVAREEAEPPVQETDSDAVVVPEESEEPETEPEPIKYTVTIDFFDREDITVVTEAITLADLLEQAGCALTDADVPSVSLDSLIAADSVVTVDKLSWGTDTAVESIPYETEVIETDLIPRDTTNYLQAGEYGEVTRTYAVEYINGVERSRTVTSEETTKWPVNERYELGVGGSFVGSDGVTYTYSHRRVVPATYYNIEGLTYLGTMADESVIAVDRSNIPLGTKLYVKNDSFDFGVRIASDVGSMIDGWEVDIWISKDNPQFAAFAQTGYHYDMEIYYID